MNAAKRAIGFDLGTTVSVAACVGEDGVPMSISDSKGEFLLPSAVYFGDRVLVGSEAMSAGLTDPEGFAESFKRDIGKPHYERDVRFCQVPPEVLTAFLVEHLVSHVRGSLGQVQEAVVTVPAYFDEKKRTATQQAARLAGLKVLDIINEPTAAAIAAAHQLLRTQGQNAGGRRILVYDLGGGTFDVTLLELRDRTFHTLGTDGDIHLGGRDFDERIVGIIADRFLQRHGVDPRSNAVDLQRLWRLAVETKHQLSHHERYPVSFKFADLLLGFELSRREFEDAIEPLVERTISTSQYVVEDAGISWDQIDELLLVGGSSRIPLVAQRLSERFGRPVQLAEKPDELIAHGAALYAATRAQQPFLADDAAFDIINVNAHSLGVQGVDIETKQKVNKIIIPRNSALPTAKSQKFVTYREGQRNVKVRLLEGESENPAFCTVLGDCVVRLDPPVPKGSEIRINCQYDANGTISVSAHIRSTKASAYVELRRDGFSILEPLSVWRSRLTTEDDAAKSHQLAGSDGRPTATPLADTSDVGSVIGRIDDLHAFVGSEATDVAPPVSAVSVQRLSNQLKQETMTLKLLIKHLESRHHREKDFQKKVVLAGHLAHAKMSWEQSNRLLRHSLVALGRECVTSGVVPEKAAPFTGEIHQLSSVLDAELSGD